MAEVGEGGAGRGGSSAMPHKRNPVASVLVLGCTRRVPGLLATLAASAEQEHQRAAGGWHAEWEPLADLLRLTGAAASWGAELLSGLHVDAGRMRANLAAAGGFPLAERVAALLAPALGPAAAHDLIAAASADAAAAGESLGGALKSGEAARAMANSSRACDPGRRDRRNPDSAGPYDGCAPAAKWPGALTARALRAPAATLIPCSSAAHARGCSGRRVGALRLVAGPGGWVTDES